MKRGFSLTEILIVLGVIAVVAAMTLPTVIKNYQKKVTVERLKSTYSMLYQAVKMSEVQNGEIAEWNFPDESSPYRHGKEFSEMYLNPYLKILSTKNVNNFYIFQLNNGVDVQVRPRSSYADIDIFLRGKNNSIPGKSAFSLVLSSKAQDSNWFGKYNKSGLYFYGQGLTRKFLMDNTQHCGCKHADTRTDCIRGFCGAVIMLDGWKISDDYPW